MCIGVTGKIVEIIDEYNAIIDCDGVLQKISIGILQDPSIGDYVMVHVGNAISKIDKETVINIKNALENE